MKRTTQWALVALLAIGDVRVGGRRLSFVVDMTESAH